MKKIITGTIVGIICGVILAVGMTLFIFAKNIKNSSEDLSDISDELIRFHVRANSNSDEDIELKYKVRDAVVDELSAKLADCESLTEAETIIDKELERIEEIAAEVVNEEGYDYPVEAYLTFDEFPIRQYGDMVIPAGEYDALRIDIGESKGENFWCLLYPTLCYTVDTGAYVSEDGKEKIREKLDEKMYEDLFVKHKTSKKKVKVKFKIVEFIKDIL